MAIELDERASDFELKKRTEFVIFQPNHGLMGRPRLREQDLQPQRIFFYERLNEPGRIFPLTEQEAAMMLKSSHAPILKQIGCSDGKTYSEFINNCGVQSGERIPLEQAQKILKDAWDAELEAARGHFANPFPQNVHFDGSFPVEQRPSFIPPR